jgi:exosortase
MKSDEPAAKSVPVVAAGGGGRFWPAATAAAFVPSLVVYYLQLWTLPHYQFFPLALGGAVLLARRGENEPLSPAADAIPSRTVFALLIAIALLLFSGGVVLNSPWLTTVAAGIAALAWLYSRGGRSNLQRFAPTAVMMATTLRLPLGVDERLIQRLQQLTARLADLVLDVFGATHVLAGNVIEIPGHRLLVEEACSGVNSLFSTLVCTLFYLLWTRRHAAVWIILLASVPLWVLFGNAARIVLVAELRMRWNIAADVGRLHDFLGLAVFCGILAMVYSTERLVAFYAAVLPPSTESGTIASGSVSSLAPDRSVRPIDAWAWCAPAIAAGALLCLQAPDLRSRVDTFTATLRSVAITDLPEDFVPVDFAGRRRLDMQKKQRDRNSAFGEFSQTWTSADAASVALWSFDYPFLGWHELSGCYTAQGWNVTSREERRVENVSFVEVHLQHPQNGRRALLLFTLIGLDGRIVSPHHGGELERLSGRLVARWRDLLHFRGVADREQLTYQFQGLLETYDPLDETAVGAFATTYVELLSKLTAMWPRMVPATTAPDE